jgi:lysophospholipase L1-like esterase
LPLIQEYNAVLVELVDENSGFVLLGDTLAFTEMETISGLNVGFVDGVHPNDTGYAMLGKLRADAIRSALEYQINPNASFLNEDTHTL